MTRRLIAVGVVLGAALGWLLYEGLDNALNYDMPVNTAVAERASLGSQVIRIQGTVDPRSIRRNGATSTFAISAGGVTEEVRAIGSPPELFGPGAPVIVVGHFQGRSFVSQQIMVAHGDVYRPEPPPRSRAAPRAASRAAPRPRRPAT